jgi:sugar/nucleoside kinase (ribokinase family)
LVVGHIYREIRITYSGQEEMLSGAPAYAASAQTLGAVGTGILSHIGSDLSDQDLGRLVTSGLDTSGLIRSNAQTTQIITREYEDGTQKMDVVSVAPRLTGQDLAEQHLAASAVYFSPVLGEVDQSCLKTAARTEALIALHVAGCLRITDKSGSVLYYVPENIDRFLDYTTILITDPVSLSLLTEEPTEQASAEALLARGPFIVIVNRDEGGSAIYSHNRVDDIPYMMPGRIVDSTGAEHIYAIGFLLEFLRTGGEISRAGHFASACASVSAEGRGPFATISRYQVDRLLKSLY